MYIMYNSLVITCRLAWIDSTCPNIKEECIWSRDITSWFVKMNTLFNYFKLNDGLPNPRGPLSSLIGSQAISSANREVEAELARPQTKACAPYNRCEAYERSVSLFCSNSTIYTRYSSSQRAKIGKYACIHGVPAAVRVYSRKLQSISVKQQYVPSGMRSTKNPLSEDI